ncbi:MAG TPA: hypothetical protein VMU54_10940 [Planctomycetota bacterium]|nr:hypothetical protein [Planctomycetota bacterium]
MLVASFYDSPSSRGQALRLRTSVQALGLECRIFDRSGRPGIDGETGWKAEGLLRTLADHPEHDVFLVHPGSVLLRRPDALLDEFAFDVAVYYDLETRLPGESLFVRNSERIWRALRSWHYAGRRHPELGDQDTLSRVLDDPAQPLDVRRLPVTYDWVERLHRERHPDASPVLARMVSDGRRTRRTLVAR